MCRMANACGWAWQCCMRPLVCKSGHEQIHTTRRVGIELPSVEVRFEDLEVTALAYAAGRQLPSIFNAYRNWFEVGSPPLHASPLPRAGRCPHALTLRHALCDGACGTHQAGAGCSSMARGCTDTTHAKNRGFGRGEEVK